MIKCGECGYENMDGLDYCDGCGAKLAAAAGSSAAAAPGFVEVKPDGPPGLEVKVGDTPSAGASPIMTSSTPTDAGAEAPATEAPKSDAPTGEIKPEPAPESAPSTTAAAGAPFKAKLSVVRGGRKGQEFPLEDGNNLIGRWDPGDGIVSGSGSRCRRSRSEDLAQACAASNRRRQDHYRRHRQSQRHLRESSAAALAGKSGRDQIGRRSDYRKNVFKAGGRTDLLSRYPLQSRPPVRRVRGS